MYLRETYLWNHILLTSFNSLLKEISFWEGGTSTFNTKVIHSNGFFYAKNVLKTVKENLARKPVP